MNSKTAIKKVGRKASHRDSLQRNLMNDIVIYEHLTTTIAKSKIVIPDFDKLITLVKSKRSEPEKARMLLQKLKNENAVKKLLEVFQKRFEKDNSGFLNVYKLESRKGDGAKMVKMMVKGYVYKDIGKKVTVKKEAKKEVTATKDKQPEYLEKESIKGSSGKSQLQGAAASNIVKTRSGI